MAATSTGSKARLNTVRRTVFTGGSFGIQCPKSETLGKGFKPFDWIVNEYGFMLSELEVISNIYENTDLLK